MKYVEYSKEGQFFGEAMEPLTSANLEHYKKNHGEEKAEGYLQAIKDMQITLADILGPRTNGKTGFPNSGHIVKEYIKKLYAHNQSFLSSLNQETDKSNIINPTI